MNEIVDRKDRHVDAVLSGTVNAYRVTTGFERFRFEHCALPELDLDAIDLSSRFLGFELEAPLLISSMTGGPARAQKINAILAEAAETLGIALAVGSQRVALETGDSHGLDRRLRQRAPSTPIFANIGAAQLNKGYGIDELQRAIEMIDANALILHLNPLQEALQKNGDRNWAGLCAKIEEACEALEVSVIVKEVGFGISAKIARKLADLGVAAIDVAGAGGTSWSAVEGALSDDPATRRLADIYRDWGIPTAQAIAAAHLACPDTPMIGSGGVRSGLDVAKAIRLGADLVGQAGAVLRSSTQGVEDVISHFETVIDGLRLACFATGSADLDALKQAPIEAI